MGRRFEDFGYNLRELNPLVRRKALEIANHLMEEEGYIEGEAIKEAIKQVQKWFLDRQA
tara:strand:+ start:21565 stop:21741 length:177 start_codon:yes stop_codon:yes gene_type:complete